VKRHRSTGDEKVAWLLQNQQLWEECSNSRADVFSADARTFKLFGMLRVEMVSAGLYSDRSYWRDVEMSIFNHIQLARERRRKRAAQTR
jgi:hypothetical protein